MANLFETAQQFFVEEGWAATPVEDEPTTLQMTHEGKHATWNCVARVREDLGQVGFYSTMLGTIPDERLAHAAELVARINARLAVGNFELDFEGGELRCKTSLDLGPDLGPGGLDGVPLGRLFGRLVHTNVELMGNYLPAVIQVAGGESPAQALDNIGEGFPV